MRLLPIQFSAGMDQSTDAAHTAAGQLTYIENLRPTRGGRLAKRPPSELETQSLVSGTPLSGIPQLLGHVNETSLLGASGSLYAETSPAKWVQAGALPLGTPLGMRTFGASPKSSRVQTGYQSGRLLLCVERPDNQGNPSGEMLLLERESGHLWQSVSSGLSAHVLTYGAGDGGLAVYLSSGNVIVRAIDFDGEPPSIGTGSTLVASAHSRISAATTSGLATWYLLRLHSGTLTLEQRDRADNSVIASATVASGISSPAWVDLAVDDTHVYVAWNEPAYAKVRSYTHDLSTAGTALDLTAAGQEQHGQPQISCPTGSGAKLVYSAYSASGAIGRFLNVHHLKSDGPTSTWRSFRSLEPCSRPFVDEGRLFCWVTNLDYESFPRYYLYQIGSATNTTTRDGIVHLVADGDATWNASTWHPSSVYSLGEGRWGWCGRVLAKDVGWGEYQYAPQEYEVSTRPVARQVVTAGGVGYIPGGVLHEWTMAGSESPQMLGQPTIISLTAAATGSLTPSSTYTYSVIYEWMDKLGRVHRSAPADPVSVTLGSGDGRVTIVSSNPAHAQGTRYIYRSAADGSVLYRASPEAANTYTDTTADKTIQEREVLYIEGKILPADPAPASTFGTHALGRVWLGGLFRRERIVCSTESYPGESPWYPLDGSHWLDFPSPVTGLAPLDDSLVVFTEPDIWIVSGDGPSNKGAGVFPAPRRVSTDLGCTDWRSVLPTSLGVFYRSRAGIMLLPRGGMQPLYVGQQIADLEDTYPYVIDAALHGEGDSAVARLVLANDADNPTATRVVAYHLRAQSWSAESHGTSIRRLGQWVRDGRAVQALAPADVAMGIVVEGPTSVGYPPSTLITGEICPFGYGVLFRIKRIWLHLTNRGLACTLTCKLYYDGERVAGDELSIALPSGGTPGEPIRKEWRPRRGECQSLRLEITDISDGSAPSRGVDYVGVTLEVEAVGPQRLGTADRW